MNQSLSDRLKSLGVKVGAQQISANKPGKRFPIESVIGGATLHTHLGDTFVVESQYPPEYRHGYGHLTSHPALDAISYWARDERILSCSPQEFIYIDTETTGLTGGTGTYAFLIGAGYFRGDTFHLFQFFMQDPAEEPAMLLALEEVLALVQVLVTFNGKSFDLPLLNTRFIAHGWQTPLDGLPHIDLLHLARKLWKDRLPSRTLGNLEVQILHAERTVEDVPGWMIPELYFEYLRTGDARPLKNVFYHNAMDILSMVGLLQHTAAILAQPQNRDDENSTDTIALAKFFEDLGDESQAENLYIHGLDLHLTENTEIEAIIRLAKIYKKRKDFQLALPLWEKAANLGYIEAHVELAKYYEHQVRDYTTAIKWTTIAISTLEQKNITTFEHRRWVVDLNHRLARLQRKIERYNSISENS